MPNEGIITKIEELKKICDPSGKETKLVLELKEVNDKIANIQKELSELKNIPDTLYYDEIQESRDITRKAELLRQIGELKKEVSILEMELNELKEKETEKFKALKELKQNKDQNVDTVSIMKNYEDTLESASAKENMENILKGVEKKVEEDTSIFQKYASEYREIQETIEQKASLIEKINANIRDLENQQEKLSFDLSGGEKYTNQEKKKENLDKIAELEKKLQTLQARQAEIVEDPIMLISRANQAALDGDLVSILNKIKSVKESLLQKPFMDIPEDSIQEQTDKAVEERDTYFNQITGKDYESTGLHAADERIEELTASIAKWVEEVNTLKTRKEEIDNGTKYGSATKIAELTENIAIQEKEVNEFETKDTLTSDERAAIDKRKKEIVAQKDILNRYFADQKANIEEARVIENNIKVLDTRISLAKTEMKELRKVSKSFTGIDLLVKIKDNIDLQVYVEKVKKLKKLPEYRRSLVIIDEILDSLGKDIVVPPIEEQEESLTTDLSEVQNVAPLQEEPALEIHPVEEVKADELNVTPAIEETKEDISLKDNNEKVTSSFDQNGGVVFEPAFKETAQIDNMTTSNDDKLNEEINRVLSSNASKVVSTEEIKKETPQKDINNPFANISDLQTVENVSVPEASIPLKVEDQEKIVVAEEKTPQEIAEVTPTPQPVPTSQASVINNSFAPEVTPSTNSIDDFFAQQWGEVSMDDAQTLGKVA